MNIEDLCDILKKLDAFGFKVDEVQFKDPGKILSSMRKFAKLTLEAASHRSSCSRTCIQNYELGRRKIPLNMLVKLATIYINESAQQLERTQPLLDFIKERLPENEQ